MLTQVKSNLFPGRERVEFCYEAKPSPTFLDAALSRFIKNLPVSTIVGRQRLPDSNAFHLLVSLKILIWI